MKKLIVISIVGLFIGVAVAPSINALNDDSRIKPLSEGNTLYVGGTGPGNHSTIKEALDNASNGDTIYVFSGTYGRFAVRKSVRIIGENKHTTIIDAQSKNNAISIEKDDVYIEGFTATNGSFVGISLQLRENVILSDLLIQNNDLGLIHNHNKDTHINNITFTNNYQGIYFWNVRNCSVTYCIFDNDNIVHRGFPPSGKNSLYIRNNLFINKSSINLQNLCIDSHGTTVIESNIFRDNTYAIITDTCKGVIVHKNNFINNTQHILLRKYAIFFLIPLFINYKLIWSENYWDDLGFRLWYKIVGEWQYSYNFYALHFHYREFDWNPSRTPHVIGGKI